MHNNKELSLLLALALASCQPQSTTGEWSETQTSEVAETNDGGDEEMSETSLPQGWNILDGQIGVDIVSSTDALSGGVSIRFPSGGSINTRLVSDWISIPDANAMGPVPVTTNYSVGCILKSSGIGINDQVKIEIEATNKGRTSSVLSPDIYGGPLTVANEWVSVGDYVALSGFDTAWVRFVISRGPSNAFDLYIDSVELKQMPAGETLRTIEGGTFAATWTPVTAMLPVSYIYGASGGYANFASPILYAYAPGVYQISGSVVMNTGYSAGDMFGARLVTQGGVLVIERFYTTLTVPSAISAGVQLGMNISATVYFSSAYNTAYTGSSFGVQLELIQYAGSLKDWSRANLSMFRITDR